MPLCLNAIAALDITMPLQVSGQASEGHTGTMGSAGVNRASGGGGGGGVDRGGKGGGGGVDRTRTPETATGGVASVAPLTGLTCIGIIKDYCRYSMTPALLPGGHNDTAGVVV